MNADICWLHGEFSSPTHIEKFKPKERRGDLFLTPVRDNLCTASSQAENIDIASVD